MRNIVEIMQYGFHIVAADDVGKTWEILFTQTVDLSERVTCNGIQFDGFLKFFKILQVAGLLLDYQADFVKCIPLGLVFLTFRFLNEEGMLGLVEQFVETLSHRVLP